MSSLWTAAAIAIAGMLSGTAEPVAHAGSLLDDLALKNGGTVPQPLESLLTDLGARGTLIPLGRSRQAPNCSLQDPRVIVSARSADSPASAELSLRFFAGYSAVRNDLEVISWNNTQGRFDFQLVKNYVPDASQPQQISQDVREKCLECHQAGGPIFSLAPWSESHLTGIGPKPSALARKIRDAVGADSYHGVPILEDITSNNPVQSASGLEDSVIYANRFLQSRVIARSVCATDLTCRRFLSKLFCAKRGAVIGCPPIPRRCPALMRSSRPTGRLGPLHMPIP